MLAYGAGEHVDIALINDPFSPVSELTFDSPISEGLILGKYALLSQVGLGIRMIDLSLTSDPIDLGFYPLSGTTFHLASWGNLLFVAGVDPGIQIFEISFSPEQNPPLVLINREVIPVADPVGLFEIDPERFPHGFRRFGIRGLNLLRAHGDLFQRDAVEPDLVVRPVVEDGHVMPPAGDKVRFAAARERNPLKNCIRNQKTM